MKIAIIGNAGSGKSTLALKLHRILNLPLYHLDQYFWKPGWVEPDRTEFERIHNQLCDKKEWIIEGMSIRFFTYRIQQADIIIFLDTPAWRCLYRVYKRAITHFGKVYFSSAKECPERGPDIKFLKFIWNFNRTKKPEIERLLQIYQPHKKIFVIKSKKGLEALLQSLI